MKKLLLLVILATIINSCCNNKDTIIYYLTNEDKALVPYEKQDVIKWQNNNGTVSNGIILEKNLQIREISDYDCKTFEGENTEINFNIDNNSYNVTLRKRDNSRSDLFISKNIGQNNPITFYSSNISVNNFQSVTFNSVTYENAIKIDGNIPNNTLIYSKTNGIEFILFEDGTWYKRVE